MHAVPPLALLGVGLRYPEERQRVQPPSSSGKSRTRALMSVVVD
jgi:hypothetical protein